MSNTQKQAKKFFQKHGMTIAIVTVAAVAVIGTVVAINALTEVRDTRTTWGGHGRDDRGNDRSDKQRGQYVTPLTKDQTSGSETVAKDLVYLIEEEKLAHDVYQKMYEKWGLRQFNNILQSESNHQSQVLTVMKVRELQDPRKSAVGEFSNAELQNLYGELVERGNKSLADAIQVGIDIEKLDIDDIDKMLARVDAKDTDVKTMYENLKAGSERHLAAFERQQSRL